MPINANHILISIHKNTVECNLAYREDLEELNSASMLQVYHNPIFSHELLHELVHVGAGNGLMPLL